MRSSLACPQSACARSRQRRGLPGHGGWLGPLVLLMSLGACAAGPPPGAAGDRVEDLRARVQALIEPARCGADSDCSTVAIGHKACGGPLAYLAWSASASDGTALASAVASYNAAQRAAMVGDGRMSTCELVTDPGAVCLPAAGAAGAVCQLRSRSGRGGPVTR